MAALARKAFGDHDSRDDDDDDDEEEEDGGEQRESLLWAEFNDRRLLSVVDTDDGKFSLMKVK